MTARGAACSEIRAELAVARRGGLRRGRLKHHLKACPDCSAYLDGLKRQRQMLALVLPVAPTAGLKPGLLASVGLGGGAAAGGLAAVGTAGTAATVVVAAVIGGSRRGRLRTRELRPARRTRRAGPPAVSPARPRGTGDTRREWRCRDRSAACAPKRVPRPGRTGAPLRRARRATARDGPPGGRQPGSSRRSKASKPPRSGCAGTGQAGEARSAEPLHARVAPAAPTLASGSRLRPPPARWRSPGEGKAGRDPAARGARPTAEGVVAEGKPPPSLAELTVAADPGAWRAAGFEVDRDGTAAIGSVRLRLAGPDAGRRILGWALRDLGSTELDGLPTERHDDSPAAARPADPPQRRRADRPRGRLQPRPRAHDRRSAAARLWTSGDCGRAPRRQARSARRSSGWARRSSRWWSTRPEPPAAEDRDAPAGFYGLALATADLDATARTLGPLLGDVRDAVQPGRRIATVRREASLGCRWRSCPIAGLTQIQVCISIQVCMRTRWAPRPKVAPRGGAPGWRGRGCSP